MGAGEDFKPLKVVTTLPDYGCIARAIGQSRVEVTSIVSGNQDAHFIRPKPSFVRKVAEAHVLIATGLDLELWLPSVVNMSGNRHVASGQEGFVAAAQGMNMLEIPSVVSRSEGGLHLYGNPHVTSSPLNMRVAAGNICKGFIKNDPSGKELYLKGAADYIHKLDEMLFGSELVNLLGGDVLAKLAEKDGLIEFLESRSLDGEPLINKLGGVLKEALPLRNLPIVTYHKNWVYFCKLLGLKSVGTIEPKPGIPPSARHKLILLKAIKDNNVKVILSANYFNDRLTRSVAEESGAKAVIVPVYVGGTEKVDTYCALFRFWVESILSAVHSDE
jgi:ABC-type Zn uptake system ZnuABC Zn-binding protein ZnuA